MAGKAPPHCDVGTTSGTSRATQGAEAALRGRLGKIGVYKTKGDTGSSGSMPTGRHTSPSGQRLGGNSGPRSFRPIKT